MGVKLADMGFQKGYMGELMQRPSETIESLLYVFILAYLVVFARRIREIEREEAARALRKESQPGCRQEKAAGENANRASPSRS